MDSSTSVVVDERQPPHARRGELEGDRAADGAGPEHRDPAQREAALGGEGTVGGVEHRQEQRLPGVPLVGGQRRQLLLRDEDSGGQQLFDGRVYLVGVTPSRRR
ncbi:hypothetical protein GCM10020219_017910 [Nonomuraea dietziae]